MRFVRLNAFTYTTVSKQPIKTLELYLVTGYKLHHAVSHINGKNTNPQSVKPMEQ